MNYILFCVFTTIKLQLLTYQDIGNQLENICALYYEKQNQWFERNKNNELVIAKNISETNFMQLIVPRIDEYISKTTDTNVYIVFVSFLSEKYKKYGFNLFDFAKYSNEIIQKCVKTKESRYKIEKYTSLWKCIKYDKENEQEIQKLMLNAHMIYIDGFYTGHDSFEEFVNHYLKDRRTHFPESYQVVINFQKKKVIFLHV